MKVNPNPRSQTQVTTNLQSKVESSGFIYKKVKEHSYAVKVIGKDDEKKIFQIKLTGDQAKTIKVFDKDHKPVAAYYLSKVLKQYRNKPLTENESLPNEFLTSLFKLEKNLSKQPKEASVQKETQENRTNTVSLSKPEEDTKKVIIAPAKLMTDKDLTELESILSNSTSNDADSRTKLHNSLDGLLPHFKAVLRNNNLTKEEIYQAYEKVNDIHKAGEARRLKDKFIKAVSGTFNITSLIEGNEGKKILEDPLKLFTTITQYARNDLIKLKKEKKVDTVKVKAVLTNYIDLSKKLSRIMTRKTN